MRISTTTLESFRLFMDPDQEWMTEQDLIDSILGKFTGNHKVWLGQAFGEVLEHPEPYRVNGGYRIQSRGGEETFSFSDDVMGPALALIDRRQTVFEAKALGRYGAHDVVAKADQLVGAHLIETKTTLSTFDFDKYALGCQWKFMLDIFQAPLCCYHVFCLGESAATGVIELKGIETFTLYTYAHLRRDCEDLVRRFAEYVNAKGLEAYLNDRQLALAEAM